MSGYDKALLEGAGEISRDQRQVSARLESFCFFHTENAISHSLNG